LYYYVKEVPKKSKQFFYIIFYEVWMLLLDVILYNYLQIGNYDIFFYLNSLIML